MENEKKETIYDEDLDKLSGGWDRFKSDKSGPLPKGQYILSSDEVEVLQSRGYKVSEIARARQHDIIRCYVTDYKNKEVNRYTMQQIFG